MNIYEGDLKTPCTMRISWIQKPVILTSFCKTITMLGNDNDSKA